MSKPKLIVTGASGLLGRQIMKEVKNTDLFDVIGIVNTRYVFYQILTSFTLN